jgi:hypothetical protein
MILRLILRLEYTGVVAFLIVIDEGGLEEWIGVLRGLI